MENTKEFTIDLTDDEEIDDTQYNVVMYNDDFTPFEYVIAVLNDVFGIDPPNGFGLSLHIHENGSAVVCQTTMEDAHNKVDAVNRLNEKFGFMLQTTVEKC